MGIPCHPSQEEDGGLRIVVDFRKLNDITVKDPFYMPTIEEIVNKLGYAKLFSKLDLTKGFHHQIPIHPDSMDKTSFVTPFGKFQYKRLPFGLTNAPAVFKKLCTNVYNISLIVLILTLMTSLFILIFYYNKWKWCVCVFFFVVFCVCVL